MFTRLRPLLVACILGLLSVSTICSAGVQKKEDASDKLIARVGKIPLTKFDFSLKFQKTIPSQVGYHGNIDEGKLSEIKEQILKDLIDEALQVNWAREQKISVPSERIDQAMQPLVAKFASVDALRERLGDALYQDLRAFLYREQLAKRALEYAVNERVAVSEEAVRNYYETNKERFFRPEQYRLSHILIKVHPAATNEERKELRAKAEALLGRARGGEDFYNLSYYNSDDRTKFVGGDMGYFHRGQGLEEFEAAVQGMEIEGISDIVETRYGYHILKLTEVNAARQLTFEEMQEKLRDQLQKEQRDSLQEAWMTELRKGYPVEQVQTLEEAFAKEDASG